MTSSNVCEVCGSSARNEYGFCEGCGARWRLHATASAATSAASTQPASPLAKLPAQFNSIGLIEVREMQVWLAVLLALFTGPLGLAYCSNLGAIIMLVIAAILRIWLGDASLLIVLPVCAVWAWRATREN